MLEGFERKVDEYITILEEKEKKQDEIIKKTREIVRNCSKAIKCIHSNELNKGEKYINENKKKISEIIKYREEFKRNIDHALQEQAEAEILLYIKEKGDVPDNNEINIPIEPYFMGLLDIFGELKREIIEMIRKREKEKANKYFKIMERLYELLLPIRFSESIIPGFRRKQDVARIQLESVRTELLKL